MAIFKRRPKPIKLESSAQFDELVATGAPVFVDFWQYNCQPCRTMDGIVNELAEEYDGSAHVIKADVAMVPDLAQRFKVMSTPTFLVLTQNEGANKPTMRWRASGLVKKDVLTRSIESAGATPVAN